MFHKTSRLLITLSCLLLISLLAACNRKTEFEELKRMTTTKNGRYYFDVLVSNPPDSMEVLKRQMADYYNQRNMEVRKGGKGRCISSIRFYKKTRCTAYFIDHDEDPGGWSSYELDFCDAEIGFVSPNRPGDPDPQGTCLLILYDKNGDEAFRGNLRMDAENNIVP
ncbi:hypothetical protein [Prevotella sp. KH2C16]|uniref:hypothetical protein n=1 Tax=Prevotella sp. KH2C16 TaxID=1855325 RepID=UPI0008E911CB|nr:hypothetical protein [Prevotella sp. KH2C16]SFG02918.1 hypothetical protein SAMN05216383_1043 [Prevotella sp. KH2C16]